VPSPRPSAEVTSTIINARQLRRDAAELEEQARKLLERARVLKKAAADLEAAEGLPGENKVRTVHRMELRTISKPRGPGRPTESQHPFPLALAKKGMTVTEWAEAHGLDEGVVRSWYRSTQRRKIPRITAQAIEKELGVRADESVWRQGLK
jgi:hypothetical protein